MMFRMAMLMVVAAQLTTAGRECPSCPFKNVDNPDPLGFWVDDATPGDERRIQLDGYDYMLVFSDEFENETRTFGAGEDLRWEGHDMHYSVTQDMEMYRPDAARVENGKGIIRMSKSSEFDPVLKQTFDFKSGMLTSFNKFCYSGGYLEVIMQMPGKLNVSGLWPAVWLMGNLGRPGYNLTTDQMWPYTYDQCIGNEVDPAPFDGNLQAGQKINACMNPTNASLRASGMCDNPIRFDGRTRGRGVPEVDLFELQVGGKSNASISQSLQVGPKNPPGTSYYAPGRTFPGAHHPIFKTHPNSWGGNAYQDTLSAVSNLDESFFNENHKLGLEWWFDDEDPSAQEPFLRWWIDGILVAEIRESALRGVTNSEGITVGDRQIPREPMFIVWNLAMSNSFSAPDFAHLDFPVDMLVDSIRVYQRPNAIRLSCSPRSHPTACYIHRNIEKFGSNFATDFPQQKRMQARERAADKSPARPMII